MSPSEDVTIDDPDETPDYFTNERLMAHAILSSARQVLKYRNFLVENAFRTIEEIQDGNFALGQPMTPEDERNLVRALSAEIVQETVSNIEALAAVSMNPDSPPEDRATQLLTYRGRDIHRFFDGVDDSTSRDRFASIFSYPDIDDLDIADSDRDWYQIYMDGNLEAYKEFFLIAEAAWDVLRTARNKITHGFFILMNEDQELITEHGDPAELPEWCDDYLAATDWEDERFQPYVLLMGDRPRNTYRKISRNAAIVQDHVLQGLMRKIENQGEPVFPMYVYGNDQRPDDQPETQPRTGVYPVNTNYHVVLETEFKEKQLDLLDAVDRFLETHG